MWGQLSRWRRMAQDILNRRQELTSLSSAELLRRGRELRWRASSDDQLRGLLPEAYALGVEAATRALGMTHFPVQIMGAIALFEGNVAEMQTGEGKTLTATLPVILRAMAGKGVHVVTSNDYLAGRDAETMGKVYKLLGQTTGCVQPSMEDGDRRVSYGHDVTYGTASEMGFDFLRDRLKRGANVGDEPTRQLFAGATGGEAPVQRGHYFALIDEADSILIDEARTPLIIGVMQQNRDAMVSLYRWCVGATRQLQPNRDYLFDQQKRQIHLTEEGCRRVVLLPKPLLLDTIDTERIYQHVEKALTAEFAFQRDRDYIVNDGEIVIVDEGTGRKMDGRKWQDGLHQAIEAKERIDVTEITGSAARVTIQSLYRHYRHLAGMTGTATQARREFKRVYGLRVCVIPTNRPCIREDRGIRVFKTQADKYAAIVQQVLVLTSQQRAILIGTPSVDASEALAAAFKKAHIHHTVLNARYHEQEADIVSLAGTPGCVTIATNMAGRGTDILLNEIVRQKGGLHVIATELHSSKRIDRQLVGRSARQGDPGSFEFYLSLEDELLRVIKPHKRQRWMQRARGNAEGELDRSWLSVLRGTQKALERLHVKQRKQLLKFERDQRKKYRRVGLDPYLELADV
ncbi:preprotein translocase subunit SecA [Planctomicrobium piriforme]|uniref:Protein translocase subunit SecA n=1 Tax=Planctomicrobium piriforme TaxID=1576369 RepID=A0A1I3LP85_9PLAN|nr:translocase [Planctomicrobium piriforme]SFI86503.1 preprotein translocase subunit SecA [Planctomicrobium piriforme]